MELNHGEGINIFKRIRDKKIILQLLHTNVPVTYELFEENLFYHNIKYFLIPTDVKKYNVMIEMLLVLDKFQYSIHFIFENRSAHTFDL